MTYFLLNNDNTSLGDYHSKNLEETPMVNHPSFIAYSYELEEQLNREQFARIFKETPLKNVIDPRQCSVGSCHTDLRDEKFCSKIVQKDVKDTDNVFIPVPPNLKDIDLKMELTSGKDDPAHFLATIDIDSKLKNIDYKDNLCYVKDYKENSYIDVEPHKTVFDKDYRIPLRTLGDVPCGVFEEDKDHDFILHMNTSAKLRTS
jgi:hypothetical protein